jgi:hypothetical protein
VTCGQCYCKIKVHRVADDYVADDYVRIPFLRPNKIFSQHFIYFELSNLLIYHLDKIFGTSGLWQM